VTCEFTGECSSDALGLAPTAGVIQPPETFFPPTKAPPKKKAPASGAHLSSIRPYHRVTRWSQVRGITCAELGVEGMQPAAWVGAFISKSASSFAQLPFQLGQFTPATCSPLGPLKPPRERLADTSAARHSLVGVPRLWLR